MSAIHQASKDWVRALGTYQPGRPIEEVARELGLGDPETIIKLASNENALGPSPLAIAAMQKSAALMHIYPDGDTYYLRQALAAKLKVPEDHLIFGHGSNELLALLGHVYLGKGTSVVASAQAFIVYKLVAALYQADFIEVPMRAFTHDLDAMLEAIRPDTRLVYVGNPNNPTGTMVDGAALSRFLERLPDHVVAVLDEAYIELLPPEKAPDLLPQVRAGRPLFILRTFSKGYGLAGLRIGYAVARPEGISLLHKVRQPFNVNAMAQAAALAALDDDAHLDKTRRMVADGLHQVTAGLAERGIAYVPSVVNFLLVKVGKGREISAALQRQRVIVRPVDVYGLGDFVRVTIGTPEENSRFLAGLDAVLQRGTAR